jgi:hypothetical protein
VFRAIEAGDPDAAAAAMALHIDNIIRDVRTYWKDHMRELAGEKVSPDSKPEPGGAIHEHGPPDQM